MKRVAIFPGSFDPVTIGHMNVIEKALKIFDEVVVGILINPSKKPMYSAPHRCDMIERAVRYRKMHNKVRVEVVEKELAVEFARRSGATHIIRSMRFAFDYESELEISWNNNDLSNGKIESVFFPPGKDVITARSTTVRELVILGKYADAGRFLPPPMCEKPEDWLKEFGTE